MINFVLHRKNVFKKGLLKNVYYLQIDQAPAAPFEETCRLIAQRTTLSEFEVELAVNELAKSVVENANLCRGTDLGRLGRVSLRQSGRGVDTIDEINSDIVKRVSLGYIASPYIKKALRKIKFHIDKKHIKKSNKE